MAIVGQIYEKKRLKYFVYVYRIDRKYNEKLQHVDHFFGMQSIEIFILSEISRMLLRLKLNEHNKYNQFC